MQYSESIAHGIMFHHFHDERHYMGQGSISGKEFENILCFLGLNRMLDPYEWIERFDTEGLIAENLCLTFDDALLCQFEIALPILEKYDLKVFWFVYSSVFEGHPVKFEIYRAFRSKFFENIDDFYEVFFAKIFDSEFGDKARSVIEETDIAQYIRLYPFYSVHDVKFRLIRDRVLSRQEYEAIMDEIIRDRGVSPDDLSKNLWMSNEHLKYLSDRGHIVGLHSYSHPMVLAHLSYEEQWEEYSRNYNHIVQVCGRYPVAMAHPVNSYNEDTLQILKRLGIRCGFRSNMFPQHEGVELNRTRHEIAREDHANVLSMLRDSKSGGVPVNGGSHF